MLDGLAGCAGVVAGTCGLGAGVAAGCGLEFGVAVGCGLTLVGAVGLADGSGFDAAGAGLLSAVLVAVVLVSCAGPVVVRVGFVLSIDMPFLPRRNGAVRPRLSASPAARLNTGHKDCQIGKARASQAKRAECLDQ